MDFNMDMAMKNLKMVLVIKGIIKMVKKMVKENTLGQLVADMKGN